MAKVKSYEVQAKLNLLVTVTINAGSLEEAVSKSKEMKEGDFIDFNGDYCDGDMRITGLYESHP